MWFLFAAISAVFYSMLWVLARMSRGIPISVVLMAQFIYGPIVLLVASRTVDYPWHEMWWWLYLTLPFILIPIMNVGMTYAVHRTEVTMLKPLMGLSSIATLLVGTLVFHESVTLFGITGILLVTLGLLSLYHGRWEVWRHPGPWITLVGGFFYGTNAAIVGAVLSKFPHVFALSGMIISGHLAFYILPGMTAVRSVQWTKRTFWILFGLSISMLGQDFVTLYALTLGPSPYVVAVKRTSLLLTAVVGYAFLKERDQSLPRLLFASGLVVLGVVMLTVF